MRDGRLRIHHPELWRMTMKARTPVAIALALAFAYGAEPAASQVSGQITRSDLGLYTASSTAIEIGLISMNFFQDQAWAAPVSLGLLLATDLPAIAYGSEGALQRGGAQLGLDGLCCLQYIDSFPYSLGSILSNCAIKYSLYSVYAGYADLRSRLDVPGYASLPRHSFAELLGASFDPASYSDWSVLGYIGSMALYTGISAAFADTSKSVWATGKSYIGDTEFPIWAGTLLMVAMQVPNFVMTGIGEESYFRGTIYEELSHDIGTWPAKLIDSFYFTACHYPQRWDEVVASDPGGVALGFGLSMLQGMWFEYIYDRRGLGPAVAAHAATDMILFFCDWLVQGGLPTNSGFSLNDRELSISFGVRL
jgi:membrane protease YdiL (CAAX protease family)